MTTMNNDKLDSMLHDSLKSTEEPSAKLNADLKREIRLNANKRFINLWYVPLLFSVVFDVGICAILLVFVSDLIIKTAFALMVIVSLLCILCFTIAGLNIFDLKKGSVVEI